jgi:hypothetical protein
MDIDVKETLHMITFAPNIIIYHIRLVVVMPVVFAKMKEDRHAEESIHILELLEVVNMELLLIVVLGNHANSQ